MNTFYTRVYFNMGSIATANISLQLLRAPQYVFALFISIQHSVDFFPKMDFSLKQNILLTALYVTYITSIHSSLLMKLDSTFLNYISSIEKFLTT